MLVRLKVKNGSHFNLTVTIKNAGLDNSGICTVQPTFLVLSQKSTQPKQHHLNIAQINGQEPSGSHQTVTLRMSIKVNKKGVYTIPVVINGKTKLLTVTGT